MEQEEIKFLNQTVAELKKAYLRTVNQVTEKDADYKKLQKYLIENKTDIDKYELIDHKKSLSMIDSAGLAKATEAERLKKQIDSPYFGRLDFLYEGDRPDEQEAYYIGRFGFRDEEGNNIIYDWRAPFCNMYYEFDIGKAYYGVNEQRFEGEIISRKQYKIEQSKLSYVIDSAVTIQDEVLQQTLNQHASEKMKTIVTSIQREQNKIVRNESAYNVVIQGVAGSGKTAVALHRIAYYLYRYRDTLRADQIFILSPNKVFGDYISTVLPELGEEPIPSLTLDELTKRLLPTKYSFISFEDEVKGILLNPASDYAKRAAKKSNGQFVQVLKSFLKKQDLLKKQSIYVADYEFDAVYIQNRYEAYKKEPVLERLTLMAEDMLSVLETKRQGEIKLPRKDEFVIQLKSLLKISTPFDLYRRFIKEFDQELFHFNKNCFEFSDVYPYLYCQLFFEGIETYELVQHFVLDEMQDYTPIQYAVLAKVFACKRTIIGDFSQALLPYETISKEAFEEIFPTLEYIELTTTYRSSYEIASYAKKFMRRGDIHPIARHGQKPEERTYTSLENMMEAIHEKLANTWKTTAIICKTENDLDLIKQYLDVPFHVLDGKTEKFETGVLLTTIQYAKGLEFDAVIVPFVDNSRFRTDFDQGLVYIATTRAMHELTMLVDIDNPSKLL